MANEAYLLLWLAFIPLSLLPLPALDLDPDAGREDDLAAGDGDRERSLRAEEAVS
jgi:hypothetical protein